MGQERIRFWTDCQVNEKKIENVAKLFDPLDSSAANLARTLILSLNGTELTFHAIKTRIAPHLFMALSTIPHVSRVSYTGLDGLSFVYHRNDKDETYALYSNSSSSSLSSSGCYAQPVDRDTGKLEGQVVSWHTGHVTQNISSVHRSANVSSSSSLVRRKRGKGKKLMFLYSAAMDGRGLITIGYPAKVVSDHFDGLEFYGGDFHLAMSSGQVLVESKLGDTRIHVRNGTVSVETVNMNVHDKSDYYSCTMGDGAGGQLSHFQMKIKGKTHIFYCSALEVGGFESVYVLSFPKTDLQSLAHKNGILALILLVLMLAIIVISVDVFIIIILKSARREMFLCDALIKQMKSTQQAERKSMNKSLAFANASHDIRSSLAAITGLIDLCHEKANPHSDLSANLTQMNTCAVDLVGILNSVLDTSKIEAGKMQLQEEEFNIAELLEDVVDMYYLLGMKKGVDMVFDSCDGSIFKFNLVRGDRAKFKQILCNLLNNATKFTSEGHISVRAIARKPITENAIITSNHKSVLNCLSNLCFKNKGSFNTLEGLHTIQQDSNCMEYIFDVDDTGKGIPKDRRDLVFENFVQVEETNIGAEGTGLGLGIVQSLVRLMGGEIKILDKEHDKRGTCFRFNVFLTACHHITYDIEEQGTSTNTDGYGYATDIHHRFGRSLPPTRDGSRVILFLAGEERRRISKRLIQGFGVKVLVVRNNQELLYVLEWIKKKRDLILTVIDAKATLVSELRPVLANFRKEVQNCKFVWLENPLGRNNSTESEDDKTPPPCDHILSKPFHGSHLHRVLGLLPEFGGTFQPTISEGTTTIIQEVHHFSQGIRIPNPIITVPIQKNEVEQVVIRETNKESINEQLPLNGKNVLVVDDHAIQLKLSTTVLCKLGATTHVCENGKDAYDLVCKTLKDKNEGALCFDYIFMDCKMPVMNGFEATRLIREEEKLHGIHTPIIALTACETPEEIGWTIEAGMDHHLVKPLQATKVLKLLQH
ncbi:histidine kinase CKI1-like [Sesamum indicum]|uniref:histidine kinase n=1 Tax=Sesamum indicum TaxID=4182 RepID=A0A6I9TQT3_SESIN|nr:histidine kinase CKI1-like [Sesamum indicum]